jgi:hypothetical protein
LEITMSKIKWNRDILISGLKNNHAIGLLKKYNINDEFLSK